MKKNLLALSLVFCLLASACSYLPGALQPTDTAMPLPTHTPPVDSPGANRTPGIYWQGSLQEYYGVSVGSSATLDLYFWPAYFIQNSGVWEVNEYTDEVNVTSMRFCTAVNADCVPDGEWLAFSDTYEINVPVDWEGDREVYLAAEFQLASGEDVSSMEYRMAEPQPVSYIRETVTGLQPTATPDLDATLAAFPVTGEAVPEADIIGGEAGSTQSLLVNFTAQSPFGKVIEMRVHTGLLEPGSGIEEDWEPFAESRTFSVYVPLNWSTFSLAVQFRDEKGNLSQIYNVDVAVEGNPPMPTP